MAREKTARLSSTSRMDHITAYAMILPSLVLLGIFVLAPLVMSMEKSMTDWQFYQASSFVGFSNFVAVFKNQLFQKSIRNILWFLAVVIPAQVVLSFLFAHALKGMTLKAGAFVKTAIYVPTVISGIVASVIFLFIFNYQGGLLNYLIRLSGGKRVGFLAEPLPARFSISTVVLWMGFGYNSLIMFAGLQDIPRTYYEAAEVDGASARKKLLHITIPSLRNVFILILINLTTVTLQMFDVPYLMMNATGGPVNSTLTPMIYIYNNFKSADYTLGFTVAGALLLMLVIGALNSIVFTVIGSNKSQDE